MTFVLLPAVDVADARAVRLVRGQTDTETVAGDPLEAALAWQAAGAEWIHLVDLDAAFRRGSNAELLAEVVRQLDVNVEFSGGISDDVSLDRALATGCERVILSTAALADLAWCARVISSHGERIAVALDVRIDRQADGSVQYQLEARGGGGVSIDLWETIERLDSVGCARYVITDVSKDGMLSGPNIELYRAVTSATATPVIASGGIATIDDLVGLAQLAATAANLEGAIVGRALYADRFTLPEALAAMRRSDA